MRPVVYLAALLATAGAAVACAGGKHHDDHEWTKEELDELERKWGMEVSLSGFLAIVAEHNDTTRQYLSHVIMYCIC